MTFRLNAFEYRGKNEENLIFFFLLLIFNMRDICLKPEVQVDSQWWMLQKYKNHINFNMIDKLLEKIAPKYSSN